MRIGIVAATAGACLLGTIVLASGSRPRTGTGGTATDTEKKADVSDTRTETGGAVTVEKGWKLIAYYLHGTYRCPTCLSIEKQSKETIEKDFEREIRNGKVVFQSLNYEEPQNAHFSSDYSLMTKSLVLSLRNDGKEVKWKNLPAVWTHVHAPDKFREYVAGEVKAMLKGAE